MVYKYYIYFKFSISYLLIKEGFNKKTFLKFWNWTDKVIIIRLFIYIFIFSLIFAYVIIPIQRYFYLNSL